MHSNRTPENNKIFVFRNRVDDWKMIHFSILFFSEYVALHFAIFVKFCVINHMNINVYDDLNGKYRIRKKYLNYA